MIILQYIQISNNVVHLITPEANVIHYILEKKNVVFKDFGIQLPSPYLPQIEFLAVSKPQFSYLEGGDSSNAFRNL